MVDAVSQETDEGADVSPEVETEVDAEVESQENEAESQPAVEDDDTGPEPPKDGLQKRFDELTRLRRASEREAQSAKAEAEELRKQLRAMPKPAEPLKTLAEFEYDQEKYLDYRIERAEQSARDLALQAVNDTKSTDTTVEQEFGSREAAYAATVKDYDDVVYGEVDGQRKWAASPAVAESIRSSESGPELAYHLAKNPDLALEISRLSPVMTGRRMALLESELKAAKEAAAVKRESKAPPPPPKIPSGESGLEKDPSKMSDAEFNRWRRKQIAQRK